MVAATVESTSTHMAAAVPKQLRKCRRCLFDQDEPLPRATSMSRGDHSALVRRARATRGRVPHHPQGLSRWSGYSATTRVDKFQTSLLTSRLSETSTGAGLSRHDDVERTSVMLAIDATMCGLDICDVSHHRCASVGFDWHRRDTSGIPRCTGPLREPISRPSVDSHHHPLQSPKASKANQV